MAAAVGSRVNVLHDLCVMCLILIPVIPAVFVDIVVSIAYRVLRSTWCLWQEANSVCSRSNSCAEFSHTIVPFVYLQQCPHDHKLFIRGSGSP